MALHRRILVSVADLSFGALAALSLGLQGSAGFPAAMMDTVVPFVKTTSFFCRSMFRQFFFLKCVPRIMGQDKVSTTKSGTRYRALLSRIRNFTTCAMCVWFLLESPRTGAGIDDMKNHF